MSTGKWSLRFAACICVALASSAAAYETDVHSDMTQYAFTRAVQERDFLLDLGVLHRFDAEFALVTERYVGRDALRWAMKGSVDEDRILPLPRSRFHFFDPLAPSGHQGFRNTFLSAPDWAFSIIDNPTYSLPGTRESLYRALTNTDTIVRPKQWRDVFQGVGQFTHLLQDMAQPQHVRNDGHTSPSELLDAFFPDFSRYERRTLFQRSIGALPYLGYPTVQLPTYRSYWNTAGNQGLAQVTNLNFVSEGTNLDTGRYASPTGTLLKEEVIPEVFDLRDGTVVATNVTVQYASYSFNDPISGAPVVNDRLSAFSIFDFQRLQSAGRHMYTLYNTNHDRYAQLLVPRAVGYSAGLISRFFRGSLKITPPDEGIYGIVDHGTIQQTDPFNGFVGFRTIKLRVLNVSPGSDALTGGTIVAVAKFHRNGCYKDDLTGEFQTLTPPCPFFRTDTEEIVVSNPITNETIDRTAAKPFTFTFQQQIPINATDLYIQVVYRGAFGDDADEVVVGTLDVFEPTYFSVFNSTDRILFNGTFKDTTDPILLNDLDKNPRDGALDAAWDRTNVDVFFGFLDNFGDEPLVSVIGLPPARYSRVAILTDRDPYTVPIESIGTNWFSIAINGFGPEENQLNFELNGYFLSELTPLRGVMSWDSISLFRVFGTPTQGDLGTLPTLADKAPFPVTTLSFQ